MKYKVSLNGKTYEVEVEKGEARVLNVADVAVAPTVPVMTAAAAPAAAAPTATAAGEPVTSPMPGSVLDVKVSAGQSVKSGEILLILEAMKMENEIVAPHDGVVKQIVAAKGTSVATGDTLIVLG